MDGTPSPAHPHEVREHVVSVHANCRTCTCTPDPVPPLASWEKILLTAAGTTVAGSGLVVLWVLYGVVTMGSR